MLIIFAQDGFFKDLTRRCEAHIIVLVLYCNGWLALLDSFCPEVKASPQQEI